MISSDQVQRVGVEVLHERRGGLDLVVFDPELFDDDLLHFRRKSLAILSPLS